MGQKVELQTGNSLENCRKWPEITVAYHGMRCKLAM